eukprot:COSAG06_NODE_1074_length_10817_cov_7.629315_10_plen_205_part_00
MAQHARGAGMGSAGSAGGGGRWRGGGLGLASSANIRSTWGLGATAVAKRAAATDRRSAMAAGDIAVARRPFRRATVVDGPRRTQHRGGGGGRGGRSGSLLYCTPSTLFSRRRLAMDGRASLPAFALNCQTKLQNCPGAFSLLQNAFCGEATYGSVVSIYMYAGGRSASRRPFRTRFAAVRTRTRSPGAYPGSRGARMGRKVAVW